MGWSVGYDSNWGRDIGYGVPATCDHPDCNEKIDRGLAYVCGGEPWGGDEGCGLFFCSAHMGFGERRQVCQRCEAGETAFDAKPDHPEWLQHKLTCPTWKRWRDENPKEVAAIEKRLAEEKKGAA